jgi:hypothetical protein
MPAVTMVLDDEALALLRQEVQQRYGVGVYVSRLIKTDVRKRLKEDAALRRKERLAGTTRAW